MLRDGHTSPSARPEMWRIELGLSGAVWVWVLSCNFTAYHWFLDLSPDLSVCSDFFFQCSCSTLSFGSFPCALSPREGGLFSFLHLPHWCPCLINRSYMPDNGDQKMGFSAASGLGELCICGCQGWGFSAVLHLPSMRTVLHIWTRMVSCPTSQG